MHPTRLTVSADEWHTKFGRWSVEVYASKWCPSLDLSPAQNSVVSDAYRLPALSIKDLYRRALPKACCLAATSQRRSRNLLATLAAVWQLARHVATRLSAVLRCCASACLPRDDAPCWAALGAVLLAACGSALGPLLAAPDPCAQSRQRPAQAAAAGHSRTRMSSRRTVLSGRQVMLSSRRAICHSAECVLLNACFWWRVPCA